MSASSKPESATSKYCSSTNCINASSGAAGSPVVLAVSSVIGPVVSVEVLAENC